MNGFVIALLVVLAFGLGIALFIFGVNVLVWNINDIADEGANFWNVFWISLVAIVFIGGSSGAVSK